MGGRRCPRSMFCSRMLGPALDALIFSSESASDRILELRHSSSSCCFQGWPLGSTGSPAALRRQLAWFSAGATGFSSRWSPAANLQGSVGEELSAFDSAV